MKKKSLHFLLFFLFLSGVVYAQIKTIGVPYIRNFSRSDYKAGTQNWAAAQDRNDFMYFANNEGLLVYDGVNWQLNKMPNSSVVRSVFVSDDNRIYVGAYNDLGRMDFDSNGKMSFHSLKKHIPSEFRNFDDVWKITAINGKIVFQSYASLLIYSRDTIVTVIKAPSRILNSYETNMLAEKQKHE